jgi:hypothetical protein
MKNMKKFLLAPNGGLLRTDGNPPFFLTFFAFFSWTSYFFSGRLPINAKAENIMYNQRDML